MKKIPFYILIIFSVFQSCQSGKEQSTASDSVAVETSSSVVEAQNPSVALEGIKFNAWLEGKIDGKYTIWMYLDVANGKATGSYRYLPKKAELKLEGVLDKDQNLLLTEKNEKGEVTGYFEGKINYEWDEESTFFEGAWKDSKKSKTMSLKMNPVQLALSDDAVMGSGADAYTIKKFKKVIVSMAYNPEDENPEFPTKKELIKNINSTGLLAYSNTFLFDEYYEQIIGSTEAGIDTLNKILSLGNKDFSYEIQKDVLGDVDFGGTNQNSTSIVFVNKDLITIGRTFIGYMQGANHPDGFYNAVSYNLATGQELKFEDLFDKSKLSQFNEILKKGLQEGCEDVLEGDCYHYKGVADSHNFAVVKDGIEVKLNNCDVSYMARPCAEFALSAKDIEPVIKKDSYLSFLVP